MLIFLRNIQIRFLRYLVLMLDRMAECCYRQEMKLVSKLIQKRKDYE